MSKNQGKADKVYFLLQEALSLWLTTFSPLGVTKRRMLWPRHQMINNCAPFSDQGDDVSVISIEGVSAFYSGGKNQSTGGLFLK